MKNYLEIQDALRAGKKLAHKDFAPHEYVHIMDNNPVWESGMHASPVFVAPEEWRIWQVAEKQWQPKLPKSGAAAMHGDGRVCTTCLASYVLGGAVRKDEATARRDNKQWVAARRLEAFVREHEPKFVPALGASCKLVRLNPGSQKWHWYYGNYETPGQVPFPLGGDLAEAAAGMLNEGTLKLYDFEEE